MPPKTTRSNKATDANNAQVNKQQTTSASKKNKKTKEDLQNELDDLRATLTKQREAYNTLQKQLDATTEQQNVAEKPEKLIRRPEGTAGKDFSIQVAMGLKGGKQTKPYGRYKAIQAKIKDVLKCRDAVPRLKRYENDWATEELAKQAAKNRRSTMYKNGDLDVPEKYHHLRDNAMKRNPGGSRKKAAFKLAASASSKTHLKDVSDDEGDSSDDESRKNAHNSSVEDDNNSEDDSEAADGGNERDVATNYRGTMFVHPWPMSSPNRSNIDAVVGRDNTDDDEAGAGTDQGANNVSDVNNQNANDSYREASGSASTGNKTGRARPQKRSHKDVDVDAEEDRSTKPKNGKKSKVGAPASNAVEEDSNAIN
ncbi:hypothetical protein FISHEDRAFT_56863 [Fistulina hepatica ATCC 64428]|uniref:Uncharacterized protein n=1 Tax=Fistulina hepatica ATCC 64428 TaxID=1128425 RepID=A0A0D7AJ85_9AGAR|nr:hypothetical protein FISHEDRAFT_56863 [Fistulina hepatica ATCC 64428]